MKRGVMKPSEVIKQLEAVGGWKDCHGGEAKMKFRGRRTIRVGRKEFSRAKLARMERKLKRAGVSLYEIQDAA